MSIFSLIPPSPLPLLPYRGDSTSYGCTHDSPAHRRAFGALLKGTSVVLWRCCGPSPLPPEHLLPLLLSPRPLQATTPILYFTYFISYFTNMEAMKIKEVQVWFILWRQKWSKVRREGHVVVKHLRSKLLSCQHFLKTSLKLINNFSSYCSQGIIKWVNVFFFPQAQFILNSKNK